MINISDATSELWFVQGRKDPFHQAPDLDALPPGDLAKAAAHWCVSLAVLAPFGGLKQGGCEPATCLAYIQACQPASTDGRGAYCLTVHSNITPAEKILTTADCSSWVS